jgi:large subunit ribosomal protein L33
MAKKKGGQEFIKMKSSESHFFYYTTKNKHKHRERLELKKFDPVINRHVNFKEEK